MAEIALVQNLATKRCHKWQVCIATLPWIALLATPVTSLPQSSATSGKFGIISLRTFVGNQTTNVRF